MAPHPLRRLAASGLTYQAASLASGVLALVTLPLYTRYLDPRELGAAEVLLSWIILLSIVLRAGLQEALLRYWFHDEDPVRRARLVRTAAGSVLGLTTVLAVVLVLLARPVAGLLLEHDDQAATVRAAAVGVWAFTNLEVANALLRAREARGVYLRAALTNVALTVALTILLVVVLDQGAPGYLLGNYLASTAVLAGVWWTQRRIVAPVGLAAGRPPPAAAVHHGAPVAFAPGIDPLGTDAIGTDTPGGPPPTPASSEHPVALRSLLRFGLPTVPPEAAVFLLNVIDRQWLVHATGEASAGLYALAGKLATLVIVVARAFQAAWPPLAYELAEEEAGRAYALVLRAYVLGVGWAVACLTLLRHLIVGVMGEGYAGAVGALPWLALGWALWGMTWVFTSLAAREHVTGRTLPAALLGLAANVVALALLVPPLGATGAAIALVAAYVVSLAVAHARTRRLLDVPYERSRIALAIVVLVAVAAGGDWLLPAHGALGGLLRVAGCAVAPGLLVLSGAVRRSEVAALGRGLGRAQRTGRR